VELGSGWGEGETEEGGADEIGMMVGGVAGRGGNGEALPDAGIDETAAAAAVEATACCCCC